MPAHSMAAAIWPTGPVGSSLEEFKVPGPDWKEASGAVHPTPWVKGGKQGRTWRVRAEHTRIHCKHTQWSQPVDMQPQTTQTSLCVMVTSLTLCEHMICLFYNSYVSPGHDLSMCDRPKAKRITQSENSLVLQAPQRPMWLYIHLPTGLTRVWFIAQRGSIYLTTASVIIQLCLSLLNSSKQLRSISGGERETAACALLVKTW